MVETVFTQHRFSANKFNTENDLPFSPDKYSRFKHGCKDCAREFGRDLANKFIESLQFRALLLKLLLKECRIVVLSSPYIHIPTATFALKNYFISVLNDTLVSKGFEPVMEAKIYRKISYSEDYGDMSKEERFNAMKNDGFYVDGNLLKDNICIFLDDIRITGGHEYRMERMLSDFGLDKSDDNYFLYFAEMMDTTTNPKIENFLNYYFVKDLLCIDKIIKSGAFLFNTRVVKYILNANQEECKSFLDYQNPVFLRTLYHEAIGNSYHKIENYQNNLFYLKSIINEHP